MPLPLAAGLALGGFAANQVGSFLSARRTRKKSDTMRRRNRMDSELFINPMTDRLMNRQMNRNIGEEASLLTQQGLSASNAEAREGLYQRTQGLSSRRAGAIREIGERNIGRQTLGSLLAARTQLQNQADQTMIGLSGQRSTERARQASALIGGNQQAFQAQNEANPWTSLQQFGAGVAGEGFGTFMNNRYPKFREMAFNDERYM